MNNDSNKNHINIGLIGIGKIGRIHILSANELHNTKFIAVYHPDMIKAERFADTYNVEKIYDDLDEFLALREIDAVDICTPTHTHYEFIETCIKSNKPILVEKPITRTLEEFDHVVELINRDKNKLMVAQYCRFIPEYKMARKIINQGKIGTPINIKAHRYVNAPTYKNWFFNEKLSGGIILDLLIHDIDAVIWILGDEIESIYSCVNNFNLKEFDTPDFASIVIKFNQGTIASINGAWILPKNHYTPNSIDSMLEIFGNKGIIEINDRNDSKMKLFNIKQGFQLMSTDPLKIYKAEIAHFSNCLLKNKSFKMDFKSIRLSLEACLKAIESYKKSEPIKI
ncbi:MAG: hypothetical protein GF329_01595 [Candidatus Lokiarchaeota archaeon]|nr:hypothetical protein [Candidatus Lokiarchaeota archaeon]